MLWARVVHTKAQIYHYVSLYLHKKSPDAQNSLTPFDEFDARVLISKTRGAYNLVNEFAPHSLDSGFESRTSTRMNISRLPVSMRSSILSDVQNVARVCVVLEQSRVAFILSPNLFSKKCFCVLQTPINTLCN